MKRIASVALLLAASASALLAQTVTFKDPVGDDNGPGAYTYPTDPVYRKGSFDITEVDFRFKGDTVEIAVTQNSQLEDRCLAMRSGFCAQMLFAFVQTDPATAHTEGLPGLNIQFAPGNGWNKAVIISPQPAARVRAEVEARVAKSLQADVIVPARVAGDSRTITTWVAARDLGAGDPSGWGYQVLMQSNDGFPAGTDLLTRKVNEYEGQHRFGGGTDTDCDPHVIDLLAGDAMGDASEADAQHKMLAYECAPDGTAKMLATLTLVRRKD
jgi:carbohydrate-binding DOMON domain-containing protein